MHEHGAWPATKRCRPAWAGSAAAAQPVCGPRLRLPRLLVCSERRGQSQKPEEIYQLIEKLVPNGGHRHAGCQLRMLSPPDHAAAGGVLWHAAACPGWTASSLSGAGQSALPAGACRHHTACCHASLPRASPVLLAGKYLEIFGRKNNLRDYWVTVGNEVTGQGPPRGDQRAIEEGLRIPNAVYGRAG